MLYPEDNNDPATKVEAEVKKIPVETKEVFEGSFVPDLEDAAGVPEIGGTGVVFRGLQ